MTAESNGSSAKASGERGLAEVGGRPGSQFGAWLGVGTLTLLGLGALGFSGPSASSARPANGIRPVVRTDAPILETGPVQAESPAVPSSAPPPTDTDTSSAAATSIDANPYLAQLAAELERMRLEAEQQRQQLDEQRRRSSMVVFDERERNTAAREGTAAGAPGPGADELALLRPGARDPRGEAELGREERFARRVELEPVETVRAQRLEHPETVVPQGTLIQGVLETAIQSDLPGLVRAQVSEPVLSFTGALVAPRGSRLIGRYQSGPVRGQTRVFVIWQRLLRPDGVSVQLASPATDQLGRAGIGGTVDTKFFERFSASFLVRLIDGGLALGAARARDGDGAILVNAGGESAKGASEIVLENSVNIPPTIEVAAGTPVQVFVAKDLDFMEAVTREPEGEF